MGMFDLLKLLWSDKAEGHNDLHRQSSKVNPLDVKKHIYYGIALYNNSLPDTFYRKSNFKVGMDLPSFRK